MKHLYSNLKAVLSALFFFGTLNLSAQTYTTPSPSSGCAVVEDFNTDAGDFHSPSIYSESDYTEFRWDAINGYWIEQSGQSNRRGGLVSGVYNNMQNGGLDIGFDYVAGQGAEYRIRVIKVDCSCNGGANIIATTAQGDVWSQLPDRQGRLCIRLNDADIAGGQRLRFEISIRNRMPGDWIIDNFSLTEGVAATPMPVNFVGFVAERNATNDVMLKWDVAEEVNVREYQVEKSTNGSSFTTVGSVSAQNKPVYSYKEFSKDNGTAFYRVKSVDHDGRSKYSSIVKVKGEEATTSNSLRLYPLPARSEVTLEHRKVSADAQVTISTMDGRILKSFKPVVGATYTPVVLNGMLPGLYLVRLQDGAGNTETVKLIKQ